MSETERLLTVALKFILKRHGARGPCACPDCRVARAVFVAVSAERAAAFVVGRA
jgi:hypothetical protein